ncbi:MAG: hypothetical protein ABIK65_05735 [Candidatus Eisenbacteria bacterium]
MARNIPKTARGRVRRLEKIRNRYGPQERDEKFRILEALRREPVDEARLLFRYHEALLFLRAYPDDREIFDLVRGECDRFLRRVRRLRRLDPDGAAELDDSGIAGTPVHYSYDIVTAGELIRWYGDDLEVDWDEIEETGGVDNLLALVAEWVENDGLDLAEMETRDWIALRKGGRPVSDLRWLVENIERIKAPHLVRRHLYDRIDLPVVWPLGDSDASRTTGRASDGPLFFHDGPLLRKITDFRREITRPTPELPRVSRREADRLIRSVRCSLAVRHRALYPIEYANPDDVLVFEPGRGYRFVLYGMRHPHRLPWESDYGALLVKNGYPVGYGVGAMLFEQMEIAVNIFDTWRGGEAGYVFTQFVRAFHRHFGCTRFKIVRYQVGHENDEGLKSGSFWFYYKLGFVPKDPAVRRLAAKEAAKIRRDRSYRTPIGTLEKLAVSDLFFDLRHDPRKMPDEFPLADLSTSTTKWIGERFGGDGRLARRECAETVARALGCRGWKRWPAPEREWLGRLAIPLARIRGLERWSAGEKGELVALVRAKGKPQETEYARRMIKATRLRRALERMARTD